MADIEIVLEVTALAICVAVVIALRRRINKLNAELVNRGDYMAQYREDYAKHFSAPPHYNPAAIVETNAGFSEGLIMGCALNAGQCEAQPTANDISIITGAADFELPYVSQSPDTPDPPVFTGFCGGDSAGGGATSDWSAPDTSPSDSGYDSSGSDSGSGGDS